MIAFNLLLPILGAFLWRIRGGLINNMTGQQNWHGMNDTAVRCCWSFGMGGLYWLTHPGAHWLGERAAAAHGIPGWAGVLLLILALFLGTAAIGWFHAKLYPTHWRSVGLLSLSGVLRMAFPAALLLSPWLLVAGALCGPTYWLAGRLPHPKPWEFWGEWMFGAVIGAALALS